MPVALRQAAAWVGGLPYQVEDLPYRGEDPPYQGELLLDQAREYLEADPPPLP